MLMAGKFKERHYRASRSAHDTVVPLSITMQASSCVQTLEDALVAEYGKSAGSGKSAASLGTDHVRPRKVKQDWRIPGTLFTATSAAEVP